MVAEFCNSTKTAYCSMKGQLCLAELHLFLHHTINWASWYVLSSVHVRCVVILEEQEVGQEGTTGANAVAAYAA
jgi:hypothetical protein